MPLRLAFRTSDLGEELAAVVVHRTGRAPSAAELESAHV